MGMHHVLSVWDEALTNPASGRAEVESALGKAVFGLCADPQYGHLRGPQLERVTSAPVLNAGSAVRHAGAFHHTQFAALAWNRGWLSQMDALADGELQAAIELLQAEQRRRRDAQAAPSQ